MEEEADLDDLIMGMGEGANGAKVVIYISMIVDWRERDGLFPAHLSRF